MTNDQTQVYERGNTLTMNSEKLEKLAVRTCEILNRVNLFSEHRNLFDQGKIDQLVRFKDLYEVYRKKQVELREIYNEFDSSFDQLQNIVDSLGVDILRNEYHNYFAECGLPISLNLPPLRLSDVTTDRVEQYHSVVSDYIPSQIREFGNLRLELSISPVVWPEEIPRPQAHRDSKTSWVIQIDEKCYIRVRTVDGAMEASWDTNITSAEITIANSLLLTVLGLHYYYDNEHIASRSCQFLKPGMISIENKSRSNRTCKKKMKQVMTRAILHLMGPDIGGLMSLTDVLHKHFQSSWEIDIREFTGFAHLKAIEGQFWPDFYIYQPEDMANDIEEREINISIPHDEDQNLELVVFRSQASGRTEETD